MTRKRPRQEIRQRRLANVSIWLALFSSHLHLAACWSGLEKRPQKLTRRPRQVSSSSSSSLFPPFDGLVWQQSQTTSTRSVALLLSAGAVHENNNNNNNSNRATSDLEARKQQVAARVQAIRQAPSMEQLSTELARATAEMTPNTTTNESLRICTELIKRLTQLRAFPNKNDNATNNNNSKVDPLLGQVLTDTIRVLGRLYQGNAVKNEQITDLAEIIVCFSILATHPPSSRLATAVDVTQPLAKRLWKGLSTVNVTSKLYPNRWFDLLRAAKVMDLEHHHDKDDSNSLTCRLANRLTKGDALGRLSNNRLVIALSLFDQTKPVSREEQLFLSGTTRRLRKQKVRDDLTDAELLKAITLAHRFLRLERIKQKEWQQQQRSEDSTIASLEPKIVPPLLDDTTMFEMQSLAYTLCHGFLYRLKDAYSVSSSDISLVMQCASGFVNADDELVSALYQYLEASLSSGGQGLSTVGIIKVLEAVEAWRCFSQPLLVRQVGMQFLARVNEGQVKPRQANAIMRCSALLYRTDTETVQPYCEAIVYLLTNKDSLREISSAAELSNFLWFFDAVRCFNHDALMNICQLLLDRRVASRVSHRDACHVLRYLSDIMSWAQPQDMWSAELQASLFALFHEFGETLLSSRLSPLEVSGAMSSYARAAYTQDMGIFDHLVQLMAQNSERHSTRQLVEGLWACGKMYSFEKAAQLDTEVIPPYLLNIESLASDIVQRVDSLSTKDTAQALYALGILEFQEESIVSALAERAKEQTSEFTEAEIANIVWSLSKVHSKAYDCVFGLIRRVEHDSKLELNPQEASNILYALGRLDLRDEPVFTKLCNLILDQIESASAQSVANVLWASRAVYFKPPKKLLDTWAIKKLGLVAVERKQFP